jgi:DNA polymerase III subunit chi
VRVDFYQLGVSSPESVIAAIAGRLLGEDEKLLIVAADEGTLARLDRQLWDQGAASFLPHGISGGSDDARQPVLLSSTVDAPNLARNLLIADGEWRDAALNFERAFFLFDGDTLEAARLAWKLLSGRDGVERHYWANEDGRWVEKG